MVKQRFRVPDMHCSACVMRLEAIEDEWAGIKQITASYHKQHMDVEYDESQISEQQIITAAKKCGYDITPIEPH